ncbi:MAG: TRAM domain-containing protein [Verrucomicrobiales bacterium]|jgi:23S rRNA (uracil1939-C5)-methyltransferase|nr:TRAM domain-containing protein [Verrucomicrobiales bacterium]
MKSGDLIELEINDIAFGGDGVARHEGRVVFVPFAANGDKLRARVVKNSGQFARAEIEELLQPGPGRCRPACEYFGDCGGCQYQHLDYQIQLAVKTKQLRDVLARIGGIAAPDVKAWLASPQAYGYRNRISVHQEGRVIGFRSRDGRRLLDIRECPLASPEVNAKLQYLRAHPGKREHYSLREDNIPELGFYQANRFLLDEFKKLVAGHCLGNNPDWLVECYGGAGFFTSLLAGEGRRVTMIESDERLVSGAREQLPGDVEILSGDCEAIFPGLTERAGFSSATILVDPPREGLSTAMRNLLANSPARGLVYVSCNPATLARDLRELAPNWVLQLLQPVDLFPQTAHFECVAVCGRGTR